jgi:hypothetical protein
MHDAERRYREVAERTLEEGDDLVAVIRGHLWIEFLLNTALEEAMSNPSEIELDRMSLPARIDLAVALSIVDRGEGAAYSRANGYATVRS